MRPTSVGPLLPGEQDRWFAVRCAVLAAVALGVALQVNNGLFDANNRLLDAGSFLALTAAILACAAIFVAPGSAAAEEGGPASVPWILGAAITVEFLELFSCRRPGSNSPDGAAATGAYYALLTCAAAAVAGLLCLPRLRWPLLALVVVTFLALGFWTLRTVPDPHIDVWIAQTRGLEAFVHGRNPYSVTFPDIYNNPDLYAPGTVRDGIVHLGFPYPPLALFMDLPGYLLAGDYRYSNVLAIAAAALLIAAARPGRLSALAAAFFLFNPRVFLVVERGWTEPFTALLLAAVVWAACRRPRAVPWLFGLFLASKQYLIFAAAPALLLLEPPLRRGPVLRAAAIVAAVVLVVSLPLALWDVGAFLHSTVLVSGGTPFRNDALSYLAVYGNAFHPPSAWLATFIGFAAAALAASLVLKRGARSPAGFAAGVAFVFMVCFAFNKFAFCNYYYFVFAALCCSAAAHPSTQPAAVGALDPPSEVAVGVAP